jgi:hypothetical protein
LGVFGERAKISDRGYYMVPEFRPVMLINGLEGVSKVVFTAEAERRREFDNQLFTPQRLSVSAVK